MGYIIIAIFFIAIILSYMEDYLDRYKLPLYLLIGMSLILLAGLREVGIDPDSLNYEETYRNYFNSGAQEHVEYSYILSVIICNRMKILSIH